MKKSQKVIGAFSLLVVLIVLFTSIISASLESDFFSLMNAERARLGKAQLYINSNINTAAYLHSKDMGDNNYFSHTSLDGRTFDQRIKNAGYVNYLALGENIAYASGSADANKVYNMWKNSPGHYANMVSSSFKEGGLGVYSINGKTYYTLDLGNRRDFSVPTNPVNPVVNTTPMTNNTIPVNNTKAMPIDKNIFNSIDYTVRKSGYYKFVKIVGKMNAKESVYYKINNKERRICSSCNSFSVYISTGLSTNTINLIAKDNSNVIQTKTLNV